MSISTALNTAITGLGAAGRSAQAVSSNIANALTEGYGRREVQTETTRFGGVRVASVNRLVNAAVLSDRRMADAETAGDHTRADALARIASLTGTGNDAASLPGRIANFEARLVEAASRPDATTRLNGAIEAARDIVSTLNRASEGVQAERLRADTGIGNTVDGLNRDLSRVHELNIEIVKLNATGQDANGLMDQRQVVVDRIAEVVPLRELPRENGRIALVTTGGQVLIDSRPVDVGFTKSNAVTAAMTLNPGPLSGLTIDGKDIDMAAPEGRMAGGSLAAQFEVRDQLGPEAQARLDAYARDLIERFEDPAADPTRAAGDPGLFTDNGAALNPADTVGLAGTLSLNALADPAQGGEVWRVRDGLGAAVPGATGDARGLNALADALRLSQTPTDPALGAVALSAGGLADSLLSLANGDLFRAEETVSFSQARADVMREHELAGGVDTDQEMQTLLLVEQAYGANAKVIQAADEMLQRLLEI